VEGRSSGFVYSIRQVAYRALRRTCSRQMQGVFGPYPIARRSFNPHVSEHEMPDHVVSPKVCVAKQLRTKVHALL